MTYGKAFTLSAAVATLAVAAPVSAKGPPVYVVAPTDIISRHIGYADLNLASTAGARALTNRVGVAVSDLCDEATGGNDGSMSYRFNVHRCSGHAWDEARPQMALAIQRARDIASTGSSTIAATALTISLPR